MSASPSSRLSVTSSGRFIAPFLRCHLPTLEQGRGLRPRQLEQEARALVKDGTPAVGVKRSACVVKLPLMHDGKCQAAPPERRPHQAFPNGPSRGPGARKPLTLFPHPSCAACPGRATPRLAARRCGKQLLLAGDIGMPPGCFRGLCSGRGDAQIAFEPPILTEGLRWRAFSQFDAYHHVLWTTATSVGQAGASPSQCARGLVTRHTPPSTAKRGRTAEGNPRLLQRYW